MADYTRIMAPVDGSAEAERAFKKAVAIASHKRARLVIVYVNDENESATASSSHQSMNALIDNYAAYAREHNVSSIEACIVNGEPKHQIAKIIPHNYTINLIVIGATGRNVLDRLVLGSVTEYVVRTAPCDVLVVRETAR